MKKILHITAFLLLVSMSAQAACILETPFPFPLNAGAALSLANKALNADQGAGVLFIIPASGKTSLEQFFYVLRSEYGNFGGTADRKGAIFCDSRNKGEICFYFYDEGVAVEISAGSFCRVKNFSSLQRQ